MILLMCFLAHNVDIMILGLTVPASEIIPLSQLLFAKKNPCGFQLFPHLQECGRQWLSVRATNAKVPLLSLFTANIPALPRATNEPCKHPTIPKRRDQAANPQSQASKSTAPSNRS